MYLLRAILLTALLVLSLSACTSIGNTFSGSNSDINNTYYSEFADIPVPKDMGEDTGSREISDQMGQKIGFSRFTGSIEIFSLQDAMAYNLHRDGWSPLAIFKSKNGIMVFQKGERICVLEFRSALTRNSMHIWVAPKMHGFLVPPSMPVSTAPVEPIENQASGVGSTNSDSSTSDTYTPSEPTQTSSDSGSSVNEQGLSE